MTAGGRAKRRPGYGTDLDSRSPMKKLVEHLLREPQGIVEVRVERAAAAIAIVLAGREDNLATVLPFGNKVGAHAHVDPGAFQFHDQTRIDDQTGAQPRRG